MLPLEYLNSALVVFSNFSLWSRTWRNWLWFCKVQEKEEGEWYIRFEVGHNINIEIKGKLSWIGCPLDIQLRSYSKFKGTVHKKKYWLKRCPFPPWSRGHMWKIWQLAMRIGLSRPVMPFGEPFSRPVSNFESPKI